MKHVLLGKLGVVAGLGVLLSAIVPSRADAASITFVFNYHQVPPPNNIDLPIGPSGPWGTLTLTDDVATGRVNVDLVAAPPAAYVGLSCVTCGIEQFYLNFDRSPDNPALPNDSDYVAGHQFYMVQQNSPAGTTTQFPAGTSVSYVNGNTGFVFNGFLFDVSADAGTNALSYSGSLALRHESSGVFVPLTIDNFIIPAHQQGGQNFDLPVYAAYRTHVANPAGTPTDEWPNGEFWAFATSTVRPDQFDNQPVPEPATLLLLGSGLLGIARARRRPSA